MTIPGGAPLGAQEIAALLNVKPQTVHAWRTRGQLPEPDWTVSGRPCWTRETIEAWARETGRWTEPDEDA